MSEWISVKDRLPQKNRMYIVCAIDWDGSRHSYCRYFERTIIREKEVERWKYPWGTISDERITHWMPLPEPLKEDNHE